MSFDSFSNYTRSAEYTKPTATASRVAQVDTFLTNACEGCDDGMEHAAVLEDECRTLAAEVDALTEENIRLDRKRFENVTYARKYLAKLRTLTDKLARVKAESLRVVKSECQDMNLASDWYMTPDGLGWLGYDRHDCECVETPHGYRKFDECRKVRLERWEDE